MLFSKRDLDYDGQSQQEHAVSTRPPYCPTAWSLLQGDWDSTNVSASAELYDTTSGTWTFTGSLNNARAGHTATLLPNGMVLAAGGEGSATTLHKCRTVPRPHAYAYSEEP